MLIPTRALVLLTLIPLALAAACVVEPALLRSMLLADAALLGLAGLDAVLGLRPAIGLTREAPRVLSVGRDGAVRVQLRSRANRRLRLLLHADLPDGATAPDLPRPVTLAPGARGTVTYHVRAESRGVCVLGAQVVRVLSPLGLWWRQRRVDLADPLRVYPDLVAVRGYDLLARQAREAALARAARLRGGESEFERLRDYQRDDPYRCIDWKATARRQRLTAREYQRERDQTVVAALDCGRLMSAEHGGRTLLDHAIAATLMLAQVAARGGDQVGALAFDARLRAFAPPRGGPRTTADLARAVHDLEPELVESDHELAFQELARRVRKRALVVLFTQVVDEQGATRLRTLMRHLPRRHLCLVVLLRDPELDELASAPLPAPDRLARDPTLFERAAAAENVLWRERVARELGKHGGLVLHVPPAQLTPALVNRYLELKARRRL